MSTFPGPPRTLTAGQLFLDGMGPVEGERYRNRNTGAIATVVGIAQRKYGWITLRVHGEPTTIKLDQFLRTFVRF